MGSSEHATVRKVPKTTAKNHSSGNTVIPEDMKVRKVVRHPDGSMEAVCRPKKGGAAESFVVSKRSRVEDDWGQLSVNAPSGVVCYMTPNRRIMAVDDA